MAKYEKDKKQNIHIRSTERQKKEWTRAAADLGLTVTGYFKHLHLNHVEKQKEISQK